MQFKVPQFIDIEDKVVGPLTFKQFVYLAGGAGLVYLSFKLLPFFIGFLVAAAVGALALALAFVKYNNKPFINVLQSFIVFYSRSRLYLWRKTYTQNKTESQKQKTSLEPSASNLTEAKLKTLSWSLDSIDPQNKE